MTEILTQISLQSTIDIALLFLLVMTAFAMIAVRDLIASTILAGIFSLLMASMYLVLDAPDVAITEAAIGAGVSTMIFLATIVYTGRENKGPSCSLLPPLIIVFLLGGALIITTFDMPHFGDSLSPAQVNLKADFIEQTEKNIAIPNVVTAILASFRGFDTLGEVFVVFTAALSVFLLLAGDKPRQEEDES